MPQDQTEDVARKDTPTSSQTQSIEELLELLRELREKNLHDDLHPSPQYGTAGSFAQPHTNPTPDTSRSSDGALHVLPEYKIPSAYVTKVYHHYHYHYNTPNISPSIINKTIVRINNKNTSNGSDSSESGNDEGEHEFLNGCFVVDIDFSCGSRKHGGPRALRGVVVWVRLQ